MNKFFMDFVENLSTLKIMDRFIEDGELYSLGPVNYWTKKIPTRFISTPSGICVRYWLQPPNDTRNLSEIDEEIKRLKTVLEPLTDAFNGKTNTEHAKQCSRCSGVGYAYYEITQGFDSHTKGSSLLIDSTNPALKELKNYLQQVEKILTE